MCGKVDMGCHIEAGFESLITSQVDALSARVGEMAGAGLEAVSTLWLRIESPQLATEHITPGCTPSDAVSCSTWTDSNPVAFLHGHVTTLSLSIFTIALLVAASRTAWEQRGEPIRELLKATMLFMVVSAGGTATVQALAGWSDAFALDLVQAAVPKGKDFQTALGGIVLGTGAPNTVPQLVGMFFGVAIFIAAAIQVVLLLIRSAMLVLLAGTFPLAAAATNTELGKVWFKKYCAWALAFIAYKPAAALVYAAAMRMADEGMSGSAGNGLVQALSGLMMMLLAVFALPALLRFAVPVTAAVSGGRAGSGSSVADPGGLATGAVSVGRSAMGGSSSGGGGSSGGGSSGGSGATGALTVGAVAGAVVGGASKTTDALAGAVAHSAGEPGGGGSGSSPRRSGGFGRSGARGDPRSQPPPEPPGPSGNG